MALYIDQFALAEDVVFINRVRHAIITSAIAVQGELNTVNNHARRSAFALLVLRSPATYAPVIAHGVATNVAITATSLDSDILFTVNQYWDAYSGVV